MKERIVELIKEKTSNRIKELGDTRRNGNKVNSEDINVMIDFMKEDASVYNLKSRVGANYRDESYSILKTIAEECPEVGDALKDLKIAKGVFINYNGDPCSDNGSFKVVDGVVKSTIDPKLNRIQGFACSKRVKGGR